MSEPFIGEIRMFAGNFAPRNWAFCDGQLLAVFDHDALFSLLGTTYGGDGRTTFGLPDLRGRIPIHAGTGPGLSPRRLGDEGGAEQATLSVQHLPVHAHTLKAAETPADRKNPKGALLAQVKEAAYGTHDPMVPPVEMSLKTGGESAGGNQPHSNLQPFLCIHFIIALFGIYPSRN